MGFYRYCLLLLITATYVGFASAQTPEGNGLGDPAVAPGSPASSYALSGLDHINYYNGLPNTEIPVLTIGGRGSASRTITIPIQRQWSVDNTVNGYAPDTTQWPIQAGLYTSGYISIQSVSTTNDACYSNGQWLGGGPFVTYVVWTSFDGTQTILKDTKSNGQEQGAGVNSCSTLQGYAQYDRGRVFRATDGSDLMFVSDADVVDQTTTAPAGTLVMRGGTKLRFSSDTYVSQVEDRNGNLLNISFASTASGGIYTFTDSNNRPYTINFTEDLNHDTQDMITYPGVNGAARTIKVNYTLLQNALAANESLQTMHCLFPELGGASSTTQFNNFVISSIVLADGSQYTMQYNAYGELARLTLPTGAYYTYSYWEAGCSVNGDASGVIALDNNSGFRIIRPLRERDEWSSSGNSSAKILFSYPAGSSPDPNHSSRPVTATVADFEDPNNNNKIVRKEMHYFYGNPFSTEAPPTDPVTFAAWWEGLEYNSYVTDANVNVLQQQQKVYQQRPCGSGETCPFNPQDDTAPAHDPQLCQQNTTLGSSGAAGQVYSYDQYNNQVFQWEYDYGQAPAIASSCPAQGPNNYARVTWNTYVTQGNYIDPSVNLVSLLASSAVNPSQGNFGNVSYAYDEAGTLNDAPGVVGHDTNYGTSFTVRGNPTTISQFSSGLNKTLSTKLTYDIAGNLHSMTDANAAIHGVATTTTWSYLNSDGNPADYAHASFATSALGLGAGTESDWSSGKPILVTPLTGVRTEIDYNPSGDPLDRPDASCMQDSWGSSLKACTTYQYPSLTQVTALQSTDSTNNVRTDFLYDGLGRLQETDSYEDSSRYIATKQTYDALGNIAGITNPARSGDTPATTNYQYDALGRQIEIDYPDGSKQTTQYTGNTATITDPAGKVRIYTTDALGHLIKVQEDPSGSNYITTYTYDPLDHLTNVTQGGQTRTFNYDNLGWLMNVQNPESGITSYTHDNVGNVMTRTDARSVQTTYDYDAIYRLLSKTYSDGTPQVIYSYNTVPLAGSTQGGYLLAQPSQVSNGVATTTITSADRLARPAGSQEVIDGQTYNFAYAYNLTGALTSESYPSGRIVYTCYDGANRAAGVSLSSDCSSRNYVDNISYAAHGGLAGYRYGNNLWRGITYNNRLQWNKADDTINNNSSGNLLDQQFTWVAAGSANNNGNLLSVAESNAGTISFTQNYGYDGVNRLHTATDTGGWSRTFDHDQFGNLWASAGTNLSAQTPSTADWIDEGTNRLASESGQFSYDAAGNLTQYGTGAALTYDAENRMTAVSGTLDGAVQYFYDGLGHRVKKSQAGWNQVYVYDLFGNLAAAYQSGSTVTFPCTTCYLSTDQLGSTRLVTDGNADTVARHDYLPYGEEVAAGAAGRNGSFGASDGVSQLFTGQTRDSETSLDYFGARYFSGAQGRFNSPDPFNAGADPTDPQSWNAYGYVRGNPLNATDPTGMFLSALDPQNNGSNDGDDSPEPCLLCSFYSFLSLGSSRRQQQPPPPPPTIKLIFNNPARNGNVFSCASEFASKYSIAGGLQRFGIGTKGVGGFITNALSGNTFSGATDLIQSFGSGEAGGHNVFYNMAQGVAAGPTQGFGAAFGKSIEGTPLASGPVDVATAALVTKGFSIATGAGQTIQTLNGVARLGSLGLGVGEVATGVGTLKLIYDAASYGVGLVHCY